MKNIAEKTSGSNISDVDLKEFDSNLSAEPTQYYLHIDGYQQDFLWWPKIDSDSLFVLFSGDALRERYKPPVYQRWSWADRFPGSCIYFSDPALYLSDTLGLAWYAGTPSFDPLIHITSIIRKVCQINNIPLENVYFYGSSGGGHAAIRMLQYIDVASAICINPQIDIKKYYSSRVDEFIKTCFVGYSFDEVFKDFDNRLNHMSNCEQYVGKKIFYLQNIKDTHHYQKHCKPFINRLRGLENENELKKSSLIELYFELEGGHGKGESEEVFEKLLKLI